MSLSTQHLRDVFKEKVDALVEILNKEDRLEIIYFEIQKISEQLEKTVQEKTKLLEADFNDHTLMGDYLRSVTEGFDDLDRLLRSSKTFVDAIKGQTKEELLEGIRKHHNQTWVPLLNILGKLENDYISVAQQNIIRKQEALKKLQATLDRLKLEEQYIKNSILMMNKKKKASELSNKRKFVDLQRQILKLMLQHDKLNLYYFNHDHPVELQEIKKKADDLRLELIQYKEQEYA